MTTVGICEDDPAVRRVLADGLRMGGYDVSLARNGHEALLRFGAEDSRPVHVLIVDIGLPDADGRDVCQALRANGQYAPVLFLTALDGVHDRVAGFHAGGDDYVTKPFAMNEVLARVDALHRRTRPLPESTSGLHLDPARFSLRCGDLEQQLTPTEFRLLAAIASAPGTVVRRRAAVAAGWPDGAIVHENTLDAHIRRIRVKLAAVAAPVRITTVRGVGFVLR
jgi:two-component system response regulator MprA